MVYVANIPRLTKEYEEDSVCTPQYPVCKTSSKPSTGHMAGGNAFDMLREMYRQPGLFLTSAQNTSTARN